jgi:hypothetical protein
MTKGKREQTGRQILSKRRNKGTLEMIDRTCSVCHHGKAFKSATYIKCTRCSQKVDL